MRKQYDLMSVPEILLARLKSYEEEVRSGRHVPPPARNAAPLKTQLVAGGAAAP